MEMKAFLRLLLACPLAAFGKDYHFAHQTISVPDGFQVELVAAAPLVERPIMADFDRQGRLYVADSSGSNAPVEEQLRAAPHRLLRLEDADGDGVFDRRVVFAEDLMLPEGVLCHDGSVYVSAPPLIWKLTDTDGDGVSDKRRVWHDGKTLTGCANDLHGPYLGPDGWLYWCKGAFAEQRYRQADGRVFVSRAAHVFRKHPEGEHVEPVMTGGMDNPVEIAFSPEGERFFTTTFLQHPGGGYRDGIIHAIYGGVYGKDHDVLDGHPRTGPLMPVMTHHGPAASCALMRYESRVFGDAYHGNLFASLFNMRKITRHVLHKDGSTYRTVDQDFLVSDSIDFHPTDVLEDADGSLLVIDTGGWYKLCCPTSQLAKPAELGAIYRVTRESADPVDDPWGKSLDWKAMPDKALHDLLTDSRPKVAQRALSTLSGRGASTLPDLDAHPPDTVQALLWAASRMPDLDARRWIRKGLHHPAEAVRHTALHGVSIHRDREATPRVAAMLGDPSTSVRRAAAETLGRIGTAQQIPHILTALRQSPDRVLEHSLRYALIEIGDRDTLIKALTNDHLIDQRMALATLQQLEAETLQSSHLAPFLHHPDIDTQAFAWEIMATKPEWLGDAPNRLRSLAHLDPRLAQALSQLASTAAVTTRLLSALKTPQERVAALDIMADAALDHLPEPWHAPLIRVLLGSDLTSRRLVLRILSHTEKLDSKFIGALTELLTSGKIDVNDRLEIITLLARDDTFDLASEFAFLTKHATTTNTLHRRTRAVSLLARAKLDESSLIALAQQAPHMSAYAWLSLIPLYHHHESLEAKTHLAAALAQHPGIAVIPPAVLEPLIESLPKASTEAQALIERSGIQNRSKQTETLSNMLMTLPPGEVTRGQAVFNSTETACITCHEMGYVGGTLGPDLTRIGQVRSRRDLLEAIVFPSASFVRSYEPVLVTTHTGESYLGIVKAQGPDALQLLTGPASEITLDRKEVDALEPSPISLMPPGLHTTLTNQQLADLLAFLENARR